MATKLKQDPILASDISEFMQSQDDFALELRVVKYARELQYQASHSGSYEDPVTGKARQYDLRADFSKRNCLVRLAIECKSLQNYFPLVVSHTPRRKEESYHELIESLPNHIPADKVKRKGGLYQVGDPVGRATAQVGKSSSTDAWVSTDADTHEKWSQALASADGLVKKSPLGSVPQRHATVILPVLVVSDGALWSIGYDDDGLQIQQPVLVDQTEMYVGRPYMMDNRAYRISHLHICTEMGVRNLLASIATDDGWWDRVFD
ncbi:hypothetical protein ACOTIX_22065 [Achromobacter xylosoxidans]